MIVRDALNIKRNHIFKLKYERKEVMKSRIYPRGLISGEREISINANIFKQKVSPKFQFKDNFLEPSFGDISKRLQRQSRPSLYK